MNSRMARYMAMAGAAAGAVAVGENVNATIVVDASLSGTVVGFSSGNPGPAVSATIAAGVKLRFSVQRTAFDSKRTVNMAVASGSMLLQDQGQARVRLKTYGQVATGSPGVSSVDLLQANRVGTYSFFGFGNPGNASFSGASPNTSRYFLFNFVQGSSTYYGWFELLAMAAPQTGGNLTVTLGRWAYDNTGATVFAGQLSGSAVPGGTGLAALAFGAAGLRGRRRSRN